MVRRSYHLWRFWILDNTEGYWVDRCLASFYSAVFVPWRYSTKHRSYTVFLFVVCSLSRTIEPTRTGAVGLLSLPTRSE